MAANVALVAFIADCLKFTAVPAGLFEILDDRTRIRIDHSIKSGAATSRTVSSVAVLVVVIAVPIALLVGWSVYFASVILIAMVGVGYLAFFVLPTSGIQIMIFVLAILIAYTICGWIGGAALWWFDKGSMPSAYSPYLWVEQRIMTALGLTGSLYAPDQSFADLQTRRDDLNVRIFGDEETSFWSLSWWLDLFGKFLRFDTYWAGFLVGINRVAAGLFVVVFLVLNLGVAVLAVSLPALAFSEGIHRLYKGSNWLKSRISLKPSTQIPIVAAIFFSLGETISFGLSIREMFG